MLSAWNFDANSIRPIDISEDYLGSLLVTNPDIVDYLDTERDTKYFIVAPKGYGKTLLMKAKSHKIRQKEKGGLFIPKNNLCENLSTYKPRISLEEINQFKDRQTWEEIWQMCFLILIIKRHDAGLLPPEIVHMFGQAEEIDEVLQIIIANRRRIYKLRNTVLTVLMPVYRNIARPVCVFIDNIDESCNDFLGQYRVLDDRSYLVWINAQLGSIIAAKEMCLKNKHVKIYISVRSEAYDYLNDSSQSQMRNFCTVLNYSKNELQTIFEKNILFTDEGRMVNAAEPGLLGRFLGIETIEHRFAKHEDGSPRVENIFDFIYRHTLGRPRELVMMGSYINGIKPEERTPDKIGEFINEVSSLILSQYKSEVLYDYEYTAYDSFCRSVQSNVIYKNEIQVINGEVVKISHYEDVCSLLYRIGLLGWVEKKYNGEDQYVQKFNKVAVKIFTQESKLPNSPAYILHSCVDKDLKKIHNSTFYNPRNIIGPGYDFQLSISEDNYIGHIYDQLEVARQQLQLKRYSRVIEITESALALSRKNNPLPNEAQADIYIECGNLYKQIPPRERPPALAEKLITLFLEAAEILQGIIEKEYKNSTSRPELSKKANACYSDVHALEPANLRALNGMKQCAVIDGDYELAISLQAKIDDIESSQLFDNNARLPFQIGHVKISNVSIFDSIRWNVQPQVNVLLGRNGYGKSHLLRLIACLLKSDKTVLSQDFFHHGNTYSKAVLTISQATKAFDIIFSPHSYIENTSSGIPEDISGNKRRYFTNFGEADLGFSESRGTFPLLAIPDNRFLDKSAQAFEKPPGKAKPMHKSPNSLLRTGADAFISQQSIKNGIEEILFTLAVDCLTYQKRKGGLSAQLEHIELASLIQEVFRELTDTTFVFQEIATLGRAKTNLKILVKTEGSTTAIPLQKASQGTLSIISMVGLIHNYLGQLYDFRNPGGTAQKINQQQGVVFIEEIDAHLHPSWQQRIISLLRKLFPNVQFFVTSHSPLVVAGCKEREVSVLLKSQDNYFSLRQIEHDFIGWTTADLYNHKIFDIEEYDDLFLYYSILERKEEKILDLLKDISAKEKVTVEEKQIYDKALDDLYYIQKVREKRKERQFLPGLVMENARLKTLLESKSYRK